MRTRLASLLMLAGGCGPAAPMDATETTDGTGVATSSTSGSSSTDAVTSPTSTASAATSTSATSTGDATSTGETGGASVTSITTGTTAAETTTGGSSTGEPSGVVYVADYYIGQINRLTVFRADFDADTCAFITLEETGENFDPAISLPPFWRVGWTQVGQGTAGCLEGEPNLDWVQADSVMGAVDFDLSRSCTLDIDVTANFPDAKPWVPMAVHFLATGVPITGNC